VSPRLRKVIFFIEAHAKRQADVAQRHTAAFIAIVSRPP
jgi:hypothetical protein